MTTYPTALPPVPADRWGATITGNGGDPDEGTAWIEGSVRAESNIGAEIRFLAYLDRNFEDDLRGATATGTAMPELGVWRVRVALAVPRC